jgi:hypothetical protein
MTFDPATWPIGIGPIAWFVFGVTQLTAVQFLKKESTQDTVGAIIGFVPGAIVIVAWAIGYREAVDHSLSKFVALSFLGAILWAWMIYAVLPDSKIGKSRREKIDLYSPLKKIRNTILSIGGFALICLVFVILQPWLRNPQPCTRLMCESGIRLLGSQYSSLSMLWFFTLLSSLFAFATVDNFITLVRSIKK